MVMKFDYSKIESNCAVLDDSHHHKRNYCEEDIKISVISFFFRRLVSWPRMGY